MPPFVGSLANPEAIYARYLKEQLTKYISKLYLADTAEWWGYNNSLNFHNAVGDLPIGLDEIEYFTKQTYGEAAIYDGTGTDIPVVDVQLARLGKVKAVILINAAKWTRFDLDTQRVAESSGTAYPRLNIISEGVENMAEYLNRREHGIILYGIPKRGIFGLYNQPDVQTLDYSIANIYDPAIVTPQDLYEIFLTWVHTFMQSALISNSKMIVVKIPERLMRRLAEPYSEQTGTTVYEMITGDKGYSVKEITHAVENEGDNLILQGIMPAGSKRDRIIFKTTTPVLERSFYARNTLPAFQLSSLLYEQVSFSSTTGLYCPKKNRILYIDIRNSA